MITMTMKPPPLPIPTTTKPATLLISLLPRVRAMKTSPIAMLATDNLVAHLGDRVVLDGSVSSDTDGNEITYHWSQSDGPSVEIMNADTVTATVTIPMLERDDVITIDLVVSDGQTESNKVSAVIDVQYVEEIDDAIEQDLPPDDDVGGEAWSLAACGSNSVVL